MHNDIILDEDVSHAKHEKTRSTSQIRFEDNDRDPIAWPGDLAQVFVHSQGGFYNGEVIEIDYISNPINYKVSILLSEGLGNVEVSTPSVYPPHK